LNAATINIHAGDMIGEIALAIEMGADAVDIGKTIHPHPALGRCVKVVAWPPKWRTAVAPICRRCVNNCFLSPVQV
jgi:hypothetical protein